MKSKKVIAVLCISLMLSSLPACDSEKEIERSSAAENAGSSVEVYENEDSLPDSEESGNFSDKSSETGDSLLSLEEHEISSVKLSGDSKELDAISSKDLEDTVNLLKGTSKNHRQKP